MIVELIASGTEIVRGRSIDTNSGHIARRLSELGSEVRRITCLGDDLPSLVEGFRTALRRSDAALVTGGLGPTVDDLTREAAARATGRPLRLVKSELARLRERFRARKIPMPAINRRQAFFPLGASIIPNPIGSAAGFVVRRGRKRLAALPGVPREMEAMLDSAFDLLGLRGEAPWIDRTFRIVGVPESAVEQRLYPAIRKFRGVAYGITAKQNVISIHLRAAGRDAARALDRIEEIVRRKMGAAYFGQGDVTIAAATAEAILKKGVTLSLAESCTGGAIASRLTDVPGISAGLLEAVVAYSNESKASRLGVKPATLRAHGAVSEAVAREMAEGVRRRAGSDVGAATTGIAGPSGATSEKPVGLVYMAVSTRRGTAVERKIFGGTRLDVKDRASEHTLNMIRRAVLAER
jgi:nicotinamide-nucleotide amidase